MNILIFGITGQIGFYLANHYLKKGYNVYGIYRSEKSKGYINLFKTYQNNIGRKLFLINLTELEINQLVDILKNVNPEFIYYMSGQSNIQLSFESRQETLDSIYGDFQKLINSILKSKINTTVFNPMSSDCFIDNGEDLITIETPLYSNSPYSEAKNKVINFCNEIRNETINIKHAFLFNHESPIRPDKFIMRKICNYLKKNEYKKNIPLRIGNINIVRNWGLAEEFIFGYDLFMKSVYETIIFSSPKSYSIKEILDYSFSKFNLNYKNHIEITDKELRPNEVHFKYANSLDSENKIDWKPSFDALKVIDFFLSSDEIFYFK